MSEQYLYLLIVIEGLAALGVIAAWATKDTRLPFIIGFNTLLPATAIIVFYGHGILWRQIMILSFVTFYLIRMNWVLMAWYDNTAAAKLKEQMPAAEFYALPVVLTNTFGWLYCLPFLWAAERTGPFDVFDAAAVTIYTLGTIFHFGSDYQKRRFKRLPDNQGKLLCAGFWGISRHPNYFGDFLIYVSFGLASASPWGLVAPLTNALQYFFDAIPKSEKMSHQRYGDTWEAYRKRVRCFIPYVA